jgi:hypothetical protein
MQSIAKALFLGALAIMVRGEELEKSMDKRDLPVIIPPKKCKAEAGEILPASTLIMSVPHVAILEECLLLCSYMTNCDTVQFSSKACSLYKTPEQATTKGYLKRENNEVVRMIRDQSSWHSNIRCDSLEFASVTTTTSTMSTRAPDDSIYFLPGHQCIGKKASGGFSIRFDATLRILDASRPKTVEDCVNFCFLWGNCTAVIFEAGRTCRAFHRSIASEPGFKEHNSGRGTKALLVYDICCDDEDCRLPLSQTALLPTSTAPAEETEEPLEPTEAPEETVTEAETPNAKIVVVPEPEAATAAPAVIEFTTRAPIIPPNPEEGCFQCSYNRTSRFDDFDLGTELTSHIHKGFTTMECLLSCHFRQPQCLAIAKQKETCTLLLTTTQGNKLEQLFKNQTPSFFAYNIKCQVKYNDD